MLDVLLNGLAASGAGAMNGAPTRCSDPLLCLLLWAALLHSEGRIDAKLLKHIGADAERLGELAAQHPGEIETLRWLRLAGMLFSRESLAALLRARLGELLMGAAKASELLALTKAMERMPAWMWGEEDAATECGANGGAEPGAADALRRVREMLSAQYGGASDEELDAMIGKAQRLADRLDDYGVAPRPALKSSTRGGTRKQSASKTRQRRR